VLGKITRGKHTDHLGGHHFIWSNERPTFIIPPFLCRMPFLLQPSQFILAWDRNRNMLDCIHTPWFGTAQKTGQLNIYHEYQKCNKCSLPYFPDYKPRLFFQKFQGSGLYSSATYVRTFPKNHALHTARYGVPRSALITISSPTVLCNH